MAIAEAVLSKDLSPTLEAKERSPRFRARVDYLDALKVLLTILVIAHHAGQPYGPTGGRWPLFNPERAAALGPFFAVNAAFFMGLFFLISAYFMPGSFDRKGGAVFLRDRVVRLGIPFVVIGVTIGTLSNTTFDPAHMWFVAHLLVYAALYFVWRALGVHGLSLPTPGNRSILGFALIMAGATAMVRLAGFPQDRWVTVLGVVPVELAHLPQYASLFVVGLLAARGRWLEHLPTRTGMLWLTVGLVLSVGRYLYTPDPTLWSVWESFLCVGLCVGLPVLFRDYLNFSTRWLRALAPNAFGAYVVHVLPVVVGLQFALVQVDVDPLIKFGIVTAFGIPLSFLLAAALRRLPWVRAVL